MKKILQSVTAFVVAFAMVAAPVADAQQRGRQANGATHSSANGNRPSSSVRDILRVTVPEIPAIMGAIIDLQPRVTPVRAIAIALVKAGITAATDPVTDRATIMVTARAQAP